jgi:O-glycosyl hydrolase
MCRLNDKIKQRFSTMKRALTGSQSVYLVILLLAAALMPVQALSQTQLNISYDHTHQRIDGFGASDAWSIDPVIGKWELEGKQDRIEALADQLFSVESGIGLSAWRFNIGAGSAEQGDDSAIPDPLRRAQLLMPGAGSDIDTSKQRGQIRLLQEAYERGVGNLVAFANSPPHWLTKNGLTHPGDGMQTGSTNLDMSRVNEFSAFLVTVLEYLRSPAVGVPVNFISPVNEPTWDWQDQTQEGNRYNNEDLKTTYKSLYATLVQAELEHDVEIDGAEVPELRAALSDDYHIRFDGSIYTGGMNDTTHGVYKNYVDALLGDPGMRDILGNKLSVHSYRSSASSDGLGKLRDLLAQNVTAVSPQSGVWMSEFCILGDPGDIRGFRGKGFDVNDMELALHTARVIHRDMTRLNAAAWFWWLAVTPYDYKDGLLKIDPSLEADTLRESKLMWTLGNFSRYIRPGFYRLEMPDVDDLTGVMASAYKNPENSSLIVVVINAGTTDEPLLFNISGLPSNKRVGEFQSYLTNSEHNLTDKMTASEHGQHVIPAKSTVTFIASIEQI